MSRHRSRSFTRRVLANATALAAGTAILTTPAALAATPATIGAGHAITPAAQRAALAYWTPQRLAAARPVDLINASRHQLAATAQQPALAGPRGSVAGGSPSGEPTPFAPLTRSPIMTPAGAFGVPTRRRETVHASSAEARPRPAAHL